MSLEEPNEPENVLERAVDQLRGMQLPAGPDAFFQSRLADRLVSINVNPDQADHSSRNRRITMRRVTAMAASVLAVSALIAWLTSLNSSSPGSAFARMLQQVAEARTAVFNSRVEVRGMSPAMEQRTMLLEPDWVRDEITEGEDRRTTIQIHNLKQQKSLTLQPDARKARLRISDGQPPLQVSNVINLIQEVRKSSAQFLGKEPIDGVESLKYRCDHSTGHYVIWIAPTTDLPVKVVITETGQDEQSHVTITMTGFQWNVPLDESLFTLIPPEGYEFEQEQIATTLLDPTNFIITLKAYVRLNDGKFPDEFNALSPGSMIKFLDDPKLPPTERMANYRRKMAYAFERPEMENMSQEEWQNQGQKVGKILAQGATFVHAVAQSHEWHYVGKGATLGQAEKIVAWWALNDDSSNSSQPKEPKSATVLYGDLHLETKPIAGLPTSD
jgi:hypothetical protein